MLTLVLSLALPRAFPLVRFFILLFAHPVGAGKDPDATCTFKLDECAGSRRDFVWLLAPMLWLRRLPVGRRKGGSRLNPLSLLILVFVSGLQEVSCLRVTQPVWPACWVDTPDRSSSFTSKVAQDIWDIYRES